MYGTWVIKVQSQVSGRGYELTTHESGEPESANGVSNAADCLGIIS